ncbi:MAG: orotate phosphoribosyltransferase, partial [Cyanobacteria bacterium]|nr:orotate phosphoribosyltransferase [Cyanobacteriota bacterium]MDW8200776.1 orotate phosphoribosyltransferase [Cyanobacteriota bacterium SKYGB_h_bin112]
KLLDLICEIAYREGDFVLTSGQRSSYYINGKQITLHPQGMVMVGRLLFDQLPAETRAVAGLTLGADPIVTAVSMAAAYANQQNSYGDFSQHGIAALIIRKEAKGHGTQAQIEGPTLPPASSVVVLEDVVTTGQSAMKAVHCLRNAGYVVNHVMALVDRLQGGAELYRSQGLNFQALFPITAIQTRWAERRR